MNVSVRILVGISGLIVTSEALASEDRLLTTEVAWQEWIDARIPPAAVTGERTDVDGTSFTCVSWESQPALHPNRLAYARRKATLVEQAGEDGRAIGANEVRVHLSEEGLDSFDPAPVHRGMPPVEAHELRATSTEGTQLPVARAGVGLAVPCADGSVPIETVLVQDISDYGGLVQYVSRLSPEPDGERMHAFIKSSAGQFQATRADVNVWKPVIERWNEFSLLQTWVHRGTKTSVPATDTEQRVETGVQRFKYESKPKLFIYVKKSLSEKCYAGDCGLYVQYSSSIAPGMKYTSLSTTGGSQYATTLTVQRDQSDGEWWVRVDGTWVGFYPGSVFDSDGLANFADAVWWGGEVVDRRPGNGKATETDMGSGAFPTSTGWAQSAFIKNVEVIDAGPSTFSNFPLGELDPEPGCNDIAQAYYSGWGSAFFIGGPGYSPVDCP